MIFLEALTLGFGIWLLIRLAVYGLYAVTYVALSLALIIGTIAALVTMVKRKVFK